MNKELRRNFETCFISEMLLKRFYFNKVWRIYYNILESSSSINKNYLRYIMYNQKMNKI